MNGDSSPWTFFCRCGGLFTLEDEDIQGSEEEEDFEILVGCDTCSLNILVKK